MEMVPKVAGERAFILVYLDDLGGAEQTSKAVDSFTDMCSLLVYFGLEETPEKSVALNTRMDWLGISVNTSEWSMALKTGKLEELLAVAKVTCM